MAREDDAQPVDIVAVAAAVGQAIARSAEAAYERVTALYLGSTCPDCRDGKHDACIGTAWSDALDREIDCLCASLEHQPPVAG